MKVWNVAKKLFWFCGIIAFVLVVALWLGAEYERENLRIERDQWFVLAKIEYDEGEEVKVLGFRSHIRENGLTDMFITLKDRRTVYLADLGDGKKFGGYSDGWFYTAKLVDGDFVFKRLDEALTSRRQSQPGVGTARN